MDKKECRKNSYSGIMLTCEEMDERRNILKGHIKILLQEILPEEVNNILNSSLREFNKDVKTANFIEFSDIILNISNIECVKLCKREIFTGFINDITYDVVIKFASGDTCKEVYADVYKANERYSEIKNICLALNMNRYE